MVHENFKQITSLQRLHSQKFTEITPPREPHLQQQPSPSLPPASRNHHTTATMINVISMILAPASLAVGLTTRILVYGSMAVSDLGQSLDVKILTQSLTVSHRRHAVDHLQLGLSSTTKIPRPSHVEADIFAMGLSLNSRNPLEDNPCNAREVWGNSSPDTELPFCKSR
jgi:hypothetical protein